MLGGISAGLGLAAGAALLDALDPQASSIRTVLAMVAVIAAVAAVSLVVYRERKKSALRARDAELARMSWRLDFALSASNVGVWDVDLTTDSLIWDDRALALLGVTERKGVYREADWVRAIHPDDRARAVEAANRTVESDERFAVDYRVVRGDGEVRHIRDTAAVYRAPDGARRLVGLIWDVTQDLRRQEELELRRAEAEAANVTKSRFLATMSHEIRTPMTGVLGMLDLMLDDHLPEAQRERAAIARASARSLLQILNDILEFSRIEADRVDLRRQ